MKRAMRGALGAICLGTAIWTAGCSVPDTATQTAPSEAAEEETKEAEAGGSQGEQTQEGQNQGGQSQEGQAQEEQTLQESTQDSHDGEEEPEYPQLNNVLEKESAQSQDDILAGILQAMEEFYLELRMDTSALSFGERPDLDVINLYYQGTVMYGRKR